MAMAPQAPTSRPVRLRGDYAAAAADYQVAQHWECYSPEDHRTWQRLWDRQSPCLETHAAAPFRRGLARLGVSRGRIPRLEQVGARLAGLTGWRLVGVPGLIPEAGFFAHLAARRFPVTTWIRRPGELDYLAEPDLFHDFYGHVPLLSDPAFAGFVAVYGRVGEALARERPALLRPLARLYWYGVEFGLLRDAPGRVLASGAGILSAHAETRHAVESAAPLRLPFDLDRVLRTDYLIDGLQRTYFVLEDLADLGRAIEAADFERRCATAAAAAPIAPGERLPGEAEVRVAAPRPSRPSK